MGSTALCGDIERKTVKFRSHYIGTNFRVIVNAIVFQHDGYDETILCEQICLGGTLIINSHVHIIVIQPRKVDLEYKLRANRVRISCKIYTL